MKRTAFFLLSLCLSVVCLANGIAGKWHCPDEVTDKIEMGFDNISCTYKFKKDGTLVIKIKGMTRVEHHSANPESNTLRRGYILIKGRYTIHDGRISSFVENKDVETYAQESRENEKYDERNIAVSTGAIIREKTYGEGRARILRERLLDHRFLWDWDDEPFTLSGQELQIGTRLKCRK